MQTLDGTPLVPPALTSICIQIQYSFTKCAQAPPCEIRKWFPFRDFVFLGSKITAGGDCSQKIKRRLLLGRKAMANLDSILKSRNITLPTKVHIVKAMVFPVVMYRCESWALKKDEY